MDANAGMSWNVWVCRYQQVFGISKSSVSASLRYQQVSNIRLDVQKYGTGTVSELRGRAQIDKVV